MDDKFEYAVTRQEVETFFSRTFTDKEWETLMEEIEGIFYHYLWSDLPGIVEDLENIMEEAEEEE